MLNRLIGRSALIALFGMALHSTADASPDQRTVKSTFAELPLVFEQNRGQAPADTDFIARAQEYEVHLSPGGLAMALAGQGRHTTDPDPILRIHLVGAQNDIRGSGENQLASSSNYFLGPDQADQFTDIPNYARVRFNNVYPGVDFVYYGSQRNLEYDIVLQPGADPAKIRLALSGADHIGVDAQGNLQLSVGSESVQLNIPVVYQEYGGKRHSIAASFELLDNNEIGVRVAKYDRGRALTIDPTLVYGSYLGGSGNDYGHAIAVDGSGNAYITGYTQSSNFPVLSQYQSAPRKTGQLAFVTKVNATGTGLIYSTYLGDTGASNSGYGIAVDSAGNAYITGTTAGTAFPTTSGAYQTTATAGSNSFIAKLGPAGNQLLYGTYLLTTQTSAIAIDGLGDAFVIGVATSSFKTTSAAFQKTAPVAAGGPFVFKLNPSGSTALYATFLTGSSGYDSGTTIAIDGSGSAYVGGYTTSNDFPLTPGAVQTTPQGGADGFVSKLNPQGSALVYSTRLGGNDGDGVFGVAVDASGSAYVTGLTASFNFPVTANAFQRNKGGVGYSIGLCLFCKIYYTQFPNAFVTKLSPDGRSEVYSSFLGGNGSPGGADSYGDYGYGIAVDSAGHAHVAGLIGSTIGFPLPGDIKPGQPVNTTGLFVAKISTFGDAVLYGTHAGWTVDEYSAAVAVDANGDSYVTSAVGSGDTGGDSILVSTGAYKTAPSTGYDATFLKLSTGAMPTVTLSTSAKTIDVGHVVNASVSVSGSPSGAVLIYDGSSALTSVPLSSGAATASLTLAAGVHRLTAVYRNNGAEGVSPIAYVAVNQPATCN